MEVTNQKLNSPNSTTDEGSSELLKRLVNKNFWLVTSTKKPMVIYSIMLPHEGLCLECSPAFHVLSIAFFYGVRCLGVASVAHMLSPSAPSCWQTIATFSSVRVPTARN